jgi:hypothetical protein
MRITKEYVFDMIEMVGKAVTNARAKKDKAGPEWDLEASLDCMIRRWMDDQDPLAKRIKEAASNEDDRWNLQTGWVDSQADGQGSLDDGPRETYSEYGSEKFEQRKAKRGYDQYGDQISCKLWKINRRLAFGDIGVQDALHKLITLCVEMGHVKYISRGWADRLAAILHAHSRG